MQDLIVVMPVYNEEGCIQGVIQSWRLVLSRLGIKFQICILDDGSTDQTAKILEDFKKYPEIQIVHKKNSGHGPTILLGYRNAIKFAEWIFQCDSDDQMTADSFVDFWRHREDYDAVFGIRRNREQNLMRKFISSGSRWAVRLLFGRKIQDVNIPYRLMRSSVLEKIIALIPDDTFAPNVLISGMLSQKEYRIFEIPVDHYHRKTGQTSLTNLKAWGLAFKSLAQVIHFRLGFSRRLV